MKNVRKSSLIVLKYSHTSAGMIMSNKVFVATNKQGGHQLPLGKYTAYQIHLKHLLPPV